MGNRDFILVTKQQFLFFVNNLDSLMRQRSNRSEVFRPKASNFIKKDTLAQMFSCEFCEISKNTIFTEQLR